VTTRERAKRTNVWWGAIADEHPATMDPLTMEARGFIPESW
jgi:hypothetical protein